jgi:hypothetical protein
MSKVCIKFEKSYVELEINGKTYAINDVYAEAIYHYEGDLDSPHNDRYEITHCSYEEWWGDNDESIEPTEEMLEALKKKITTDYTWFNGDWEWNDSPTGLDDCDYAYDCAMARWESKLDRCDL